MSQEDTAHVREEFSRVLPNPIKDSNIVCLPKVSEQEYELHKQNNLALDILTCLNTPLCIMTQVIKRQEYYQARSTDEYIQMSRYDCNNAVVLEHILRMNLGFENKFIIFNLNNVNEGKIFGSHKLNNIFLVFEGDTKIFGGTDSNEFIMFRDKYNGSIYLNNSVSNIIDISQLSNDIISLEYDNQSMIITADKGVFRLHELKNTNIKYIGRKYKVDKIICKQLLHQRDGHIVDDDNKIEHNIIIDSGGGLNYYQQDEILNCTDVIVSPNTLIQGGYNNYTIYIQSLDYAKNYSEYATSEINIAGNGTILFPEISLLKDCKILQQWNHSLSIIMPLRNNAQYELVLSNNKDHNPNYVLIDKDNNRIVILDYDKFVLYVECNFDTIIKVVKHYRDILDSMQDYVVFGIVNNKQYNNVLQFGTSENDIININKDVAYVEGNNSSDLYIINDNIDYPVRINNKAQDLQLDILKLPINDILNISLIANDNHLHLLFNNKDEVKGYRDIPQEVIIDNYFQDNLYRHIALMDKNNNGYIPFNQSEVIELLPFYHASFERNIFILSSNNKKAVIDIDVDNIVLHKQGNNLLLTEKLSDNFNSLNIILSDYNKDQQAWLGMKLYTYNNGDIGSIVDLNNTELSTIKYQDQYDSLIKEYVVDLTAKNHQINCNQQKFNPLAKENHEERISIVIFQNMSIDSLKAKKHNNDLILKNSISNKKLTIKNWYNNYTEHRISMFEFNTGVEPERIYISHDFIRKIRFNNRLSNKIFNLDNKTVSAVISYLMSSCDKQDILEKRLTYSFLENEKNRLSNNDLPVEEIIKDINSSNDTSGKALLLLAAKAHNKLLLQYDLIEKDILHNSCFNTILSSSKIQEMIKCINTHKNNNFTRFEQFIDNNKKEIQNIITKLATSHISLDNHHKHRHHHGEDNRDGYHSDNKTILGHHRVHRDIEDVQQIEKDDHNYIPNSDVEVMSISSSGSSAKPIGYSMVNWIRDNVSKYLFNHVKKEIVSNIDDNVIKKEILDIDVSDNQFDPYNYVGELNHIIAFDGVSRPVCEKQPIGNAIHNNKISSYTAFDTNATLMLINVIVRKFTGVKDNYDNKSIITNDLNTEYAQNLVYSSYAPNTEENKDNIGLLGTSDT